MAAVGDGDAHRADDVRNRITVVVVVVTRKIVMIMMMQVTVLMVVVICSTGDDGNHVDEWHDDGEGRRTHRPRCS